MNRVMIIGNLVQDPDTRQITESRSVCKLRLAMDGYKKDDVIYVDVDAWGKLASVCDEYLEKGKKISVDGRLALDQWETPEGQKRQKLYIVADQIDFLSPKNTNGEAAKPSPKKSSEDNDDIPF